MIYKNKTVDEAREALEEAVADLLYFGWSPERIHEVVDDEVERCFERMEP